MYVYMYICIIVDTIISIIIIIIYRYIYRYIYIYIYIHTRTYRDIYDTTDGIGTTGVRPISVLRFWVSEALTQA